MLNACLIFHSDIYYHTYLLEVEKVFSLTERWRGRDVRFIKPCMVRLEISYLISTFFEEAYGKKSHENV